MKGERALTEDEKRAASRERIAEIVWKIQLLTADELVELKNELGDDGPDIGVREPRRPNDPEGEEGFALERGG